ncbi:hypothetical protein BVG79_00704 [Ketogulonicigenium robustum]|uniref:Uncharacterized protein n=1 Tax=Ketogulonicigenium robustum TaxID=92947 RepID=A0A1W6NXT3_9RHOB|nr:hypothetical protein BVG79_00704 [Ketogulonicigenium robustum]
MQLPVGGPGDALQAEHSAAALARLSRVASGRLARLGAPRAPLQAARAAW